MSIPLFSLRPLRVLAERSRDAAGGWGMVKLMPGSIFQTTDSQQPLTARCLAGYDVVSVVGLSRHPYPARELDLLESFVKRGGTLVIVLEDGSFIPSGATVMMLDQEEEYPVGQRGEVFIPSLAESNELLVSWKGRGCQIDIKLPPDSPPLADLGKYTCQGVLP